MTSRHALTLALLAALAASGCMQQDDTSSSRTTADGADATASDTAMAADDSMAADSMAGDATALPAARYQVTFSSRWTEKDHPLEYPGPKFAGLSVAHFSPIIGASHQAGYSLFAEGATPTPGLERLSEEGKHDPLGEEIAAAMAAGQVLAKLENDAPLKDHMQSLQAEVGVDGAHPQVSLVAMIAPSPDWFAGVRDVSLVENGQWVAEKTVTVFAWDAGTDVGTTYKAPDANSREKIAGNDARHFQKDGQAVPVGTFTFVRQ